MRAPATLLLICATLMPCLACAQGYDVVRIDSPVAETTIHDNNGDLEIDVSVSPPLDERKGDYFTLLLDGQVVASGPLTHFGLTGIDRGAHTLEVQVNSSDGKVLATSAPVTFYMWRVSALFKNPNRMK